MKLSKLDLIQTKKTEIRLQVIKQRRWEEFNYDGWQFAMRILAGGFLIALFIISAICALISNY